MRIALIEDHQMLRELIVPLLRDDLGHVLVGAVGTVAEGVALCRKEKPDVVLADWMLPDGRGFDILRAVTEQLPATRWLFMSSNENGHLVREAVALRVHGFVLKRGPLDTLRTAIREVAAGRTYYCPESSRLLVSRLVDDGLAPASQLTAREIEVLRAFARGDNLKSIADRTGTSIRTVQNHLSTIREKLDLREPAELVHYALRHGLVEAT
jgi:DNA-binding NarL/FixJ family response regulator